MNNTIFFAFHLLGHQSGFFDGLVVFLAVYFPYVVIILAGIFIIFHHEVFKAENPFKFFLQRKREILKVFFSGVFAWCVAQVFKFVIHAPRPINADLIPNVRPLFTETGYAFPSGHATFFMALAVSIFLLHKKTGYMFVFFALVIGLARIVAGVHFPVDILAGFVLGAGIAYLLKNI